MRARDLALSLVSTALVAWWFALHPQPLLLGTTPQAVIVPWWYQAAAFPPFFLMLGVLARKPTHARFVLLGGASGIAFIRLAGLIPLSGHATFLSACLVFTCGDEWLAFATALAGLTLTTIYKVQWGDELYFGLSLVAGIALGVGARRVRDSRQ